MSSERRQTSNDAVVQATATLAVAESLLAVHEVLVEIRDRMPAGSGPAE